MYHKALYGGLAICLLLIAIIIWLSYASQTAPGSTGVTSPQTAAHSLSNSPAPKPGGFQLLISYTESGFQPAIAHVKPGNTVRFTNNSSGTLWVSAYGRNVYPRESSSCGQSALDSCKAIARGAFWEFTLKNAGTWLYQNKNDTSKNGSIVVK